MHLARVMVRVRTDARLGAKVIPNRHRQPGEPPVRKRVDEHEGRVGAHRAALAREARVRFGGLDGPCAELVGWRCVGVVGDVGEDVVLVDELPRGARVRAATWT